jgi:hypothetical protein
MVDPVTAPASTTSRLGQWWVRRYTAGLPATLRERRRAEIAADLADHATDRARDEWTGRSVAAERLGRLLRGLPSDVMWRRDVLAATRGRRAGSFGWLAHGWPTLTGLALGGFYIVFALYVFGLDALADTPVLRLFGLDDLTGRAVGASIVLALGVVVVAAAFARPVTIVASDVATVVAAVPALTLLWMVVPTILAAAAIGGAVWDLCRPRPDSLARSNDDALDRVIEATGGPCAIHYERGHPPGSPARGKR